MKVKKIKKIRAFIAGLLATLYLKAPHVFAQVIPPPQDAMVVYASPEVMTCGRNKVCRFFLDNLKITLSLGLIILLAIIFGLVKLILKALRKKQDKNTSKPNSQ
ncbi:MAG: hypothetical protein XD98_0049 [Microgenomates bacterium 39_6]|nr:MAG: hypothetical protein XD98_0049 [Microgenomates bacterium 39_6]